MPLQAKNTLIRLLVFEKASMPLKNWFLFLDERDLNADHWS